MITASVKLIPIASSANDLISCRMKAEISSGLYSLSRIWSLTSPLLAGTTA